ncbi:MAG: ABC transporter ATP-binding protein, partial [Bacteroidota bacterium]
YFDLVLYGRALKKVEVATELAPIIDKISSTLDRIVEAYEAAGKEEQDRVIANKAVAELALDQYPEFPEQGLLLSTKGLKKRYEQDGFVLGEIDIAIQSGEILGVIGKNANGKTTLFRLLAGKLKPSAGQVQFPGLTSAHDPRIMWPEVVTQIAYVPQELPKWYGDLRMNIQFEAAIHGVQGEENAMRTDFIIQRMDLEGHLKKKWSELSGGYKLRFALAKALVWQPRVLLLDEPLANLDVNAQQLIISDLRQLAKSLRYPVSIVISSQHLYEVEAIADTLLFLEDGKPVFYGAQQEIGAESEELLFELQVEDLELEDLRKILASINAISLRQSGSFFVLECAAGQKQAVLQQLFDAGVNLQYFRDISSSVKRLFGDLEQ